MEKMQSLSPIKVTCALIVGESGMLFAAQRSSTMKLPLKWELPGGKLEENETEEQCLIREIEEELNVQIEVVKRLPENLHNYPTFDILLIPFICKISSGDIQLKEHANFKWLLSNELLALDWAEADVPIIKTYLNESNAKF